MAKLAVLLMFLLSCNASKTNQAETAQNASTSSTNAVILTDTIVPAQFDASGALVKIEKTEAEWKKLLDANEFNILREKGTERAFTGDLWDNKVKGIYTCAACDLPLFDSATKFKSGTGWPSFYAPFDARFVLEESDTKYGMVRTEILCGRCGGHQGHVFDDGPQPSGLRYCINSASMNFVPK